MEINTINQLKNIRSRSYIITSVALLVMLSLLIIFHLLILVRVIPFDFIWGGKLKNISQVLLFETVSVVISLLMMAVVAISVGVVKSKLHPVPCHNQVCPLGNVCALCFKYNREF